MRTDHNGFMLGLIIKDHFRLTPLFSSTEILLQFLSI